jgi:hypothetical protein
LAPPEDGAATIREVHELLDRMRDDIVHAVRQDQRSQMDFNLNIASRMEAMSTRLSAHETMPSHPAFQVEMNRATESMRSSIGDLRDDLKEVGTQVTNLRISYARAAGIAFAVALVISILVQVLPRVLT